jgi:hypothetical protein
MRLINTSTLEFKEFMGAVSEPYAILSHTWEDEEVSYQEMCSKTPEVLRKRGYKKVEKICEIAKRDGHAYVWVDTCAIDKTSSTELSEAINSMFKW